MARLVAVTGATGFVGSRIVRALAASGWQVRILARHMPTAALSPGTCLDVVLGDLNDTAALQALVKDADLAIHVAGIVKAQHPADFRTINEGGTIKVLEALNAGNSTARLIHISSITAREPQLSPYAASKNAGEAAVERLASGGRNWVILRPPAVYGPGDLEILPLFQAAATGFCPYPAAPDARVSVIHVEDLAGAVAILANAAAWPAARYDVGDGQSYSWDEIHKALGSALGRSVTGFRLPRPLLYPIAAASQLAQALTGEFRVLSLAKIPELYHPDWAVRGNRAHSLVS
jgi:nucleoside-diphosphate-sugar epimerase